MPEHSLSRRLAGSALLVAGLALAVALAGRAPERPEHGALEGAGGGGEGRGVPLGQRIAAVERRLSRVEARLAEPTPSARPDVAVRAELAELRREVARLSRPSASGAPPSAAPPPVPVEAPGARRRFSRLSPRQAGLAVVETDDGALQVTNTDPALTGQYIVVPAVGLDGQPTQVTITVPPP